ncbi:MAG: hypothetical protein DMG04_18810 [Acidobacteria bacterium]|nr:MAG: hypothetical protein DMG04_18810 [Acidobacteriota bacterium]PYQ86771.1 MAG: hypothetical protein DMG02_24070 [Acidobacteriota bacterium]PYQ89804.1 MAG: hypothetical protein DMG03_01460 [Acidobacteriota bacterium]PYR08450.1 MAG: hypothetical protein DMF99_19200 [Acidobacteriota bacterium]
MIQSCRATRRESSRRAARIGHRPSGSRPRRSTRPPGLRPRPDGQGRDPPNRTACKDSARSCPP